MRILLCITYNPLCLRFKPSELAIYPPLGLGYIASCLLRNGHEVSILDDNIRRLNSEQFKDYVKNYSPDIVGFTAYTVNVNNCLFLAKCVKEVHPDTKVVFGGPHASYLPYETISSKFVDMIVIGEGEETMTELVNILAKKELPQGVKGLLYKDNNKIINNGPRTLIKDLDAIPFPAYELMDMGDYYQTITHGFSGRKFGTIVTSRGCPYECTFCSHKIFGKNVRFRSSESVIDELELLINGFGVGEIMFVDDTFTVDKKRVIAICELILKHGLDIIWNCDARADCSSEEVYSVMGRAGCKGIFFGVEAGTQEMLDSIKKGITIEQIEKAVKLAKKYIGHVVCGFILGMPGDTLESARKTIEFAKKLNPDYATFSIACPLPGSEIFEQVVKKGTIDKNNANWENFVFLFPSPLPIVALSEISREELIMLAKKAFREFYFRPGYIWERMRKIKSASEIYQYLRGIRTILNYEFANFRNKYK